MPGARLLMSLPLLLLLCRLFLASGSAAVGRLGSTT